jgi:tRNA (guanine-N7-)-methyltransferase
LQSVSGLIWDGRTPGDRRELFVEVGCGMGGFITRLAEKRPDCLFLAAERDANVAVRAMELTRALGLTNLFFHLGGADTLELEEGSVSGIYLNFSDPWPRRGHAHRRLTHPEYLVRYAAMLTPGGRLEMKTDNPGLFAYSRKVLTEGGWKIAALDLNLSEGNGNIATEYETRFRERGIPVLYLSARLPGF